MHKTEKTLEIEDTLMRYHAQVRAGTREKVFGFHKALADRYGLTKGRVTNIARSIGLTGRKPRRHRA